MSVEESFIDRLPAAIPTSEFYSSDTIEVPEDSDPDSVDGQVYRLSKTPFNALVSVTARIDGSRTELYGNNSGVSPVDVTSIDGYDSVEITAGVVEPGSEISVVYRTKPIMVRYVGAYDDDIERVGELYDSVIDARSVETATGSQLDLLGSNFSSFGRRATRTDSEYAAFLRSLVPSFRATGTEEDIKFAVSAATGLERENIIVEEFTDIQKFDVILESDDVLIAPSDLGDVIERTSPAGISLRSNPINRSTISLSIRLSFSRSTQRSSGLNSGSLNNNSVNDSVQTYASIWV